MIPSHQRWFFSIPLLLFFSPCYAQNYGGRAQGMAGSTIANIDAWTCLNNPGAIGLLKEKSISVDSKIPYGIIGLSELSLSLNGPIPTGQISLAFSKKGLEAFKENRISFAYGFRGSNYSFGVGFNLIQIQMGEYGTVLKPIFEIGGITQVVPRLNFGLSLFNATFTSIQPNGFKEWLPISIRVGAQYTPTDFLGISLEFQKSMEIALQTKFGLEYAVSENFGFQLGLSLNPGNQTAGFYLKNRSLIINPAFSYNPNLGATGGISLSYILNAKDS